MGKTISQKSFSENLGGVLCQLFSDIPTLAAYFLLMFAGMGITAGAHRLWTHRSYKATFALRLLLVVAQTMAIQNHVIEWARDHRSVQGSQVSSGITDQFRDQRSVQGSQVSSEITGKFRDYRSVQGSQVSSGMTGQFRDDRSVQRSQVSSGITGQFRNYGSFKGSQVSSEITGQFRDHRSVQ
jgi:hypothetical protein